MPAILAQAARLEFQDRYLRSRQSAGDGRQETDRRIPEKTKEEIQMSKQYTKEIKRKRRIGYLKRRKARAKLSKKTAPAAN